MSRRTFVSGLAAFATLVPWGQARAEDRYPSRPVRFVVPFAPGGPADAISRLVTSRLQEQLGQPVVIENIPGTGGGLGVARLARMPADGYSIGFAHTATFGIGPHLFKNVGYNAEKDFTPIARMCEYINVLVVRADSAFQSLNDLLAAAQARPGTVNYGSAGNGSSNHLSGELLAMQSKTGLTHVPYRGSALALNDVLAGNLQFMFDAPNIALPHLRSGKLRALATTGRTRHRLLPEVPAVNETLPGYEVIGWMGVVGPAGLPVAAQRRLAAEIEKTLAAPDTADRIAALGLDVSYGGPQELGQAIRRDLALWGPVIKASGLRLD
jgi:tripartite-type tricarboxylate transporter receptor subunit TctC